MFTNIYPFSGSFPCYYPLWDCSLLRVASQFLATVWSAFGGASVTRRGQQRARASLTLAVHSTLESQGAKHPTLCCWSLASVTRWTLLSNSPINLAKNMDQRQHHGAPWWHQVGITDSDHLGQRLLLPPNLSTGKRLFLKINIVIK